ncbi:hypothetical protein FB45DRAFT_1066217 [Roridomyces roridus]|uniref:Hydrophobin n=1 Tax=Roridomyces roridus TaxID=1738132 RepID=A0AAD7B4J7_9AGAR|nr:hypothetical protein FB45DRAFT_1066217 [Roridomyces roridus]
MFSKLSVVVASVFVALAAASPQYYGTTTYPDSCGSVTTTDVPPPVQSVSSAPATSITSIPTMSTDIPPADSASSAPASSGVATTTGGAAPPSSTGTTGTSNQCCTSVQHSNSNAVSAIAGLLGLDLSGLNVPIGLGCSPITVLGNNCGGTQVTCNSPEKEYGSLIAINCVQLVL